MTIDSFFFFKQQSVNTSTIEDIEQGFVEDPRRLYYGNDLAAGIALYENFPVAFFQKIIIKYAASNYIGRRNTWVSNGEDGLPDRRAISSQSVIEVDRGGDGEWDITAKIYPLNGANDPTLLVAEAEIA